mgnify:CR=1 FL=1
MKAKEKAHLTHVEDIFEMNEAYIVYSHDMLRRFSKKDMSPLGEVSDYMGATSFLMDKDSPYLVELNSLKKLRVRDGKTLEILSETKEILPFYMPFRACFSLDGTKLLVLAANPAGPTYPLFFSSLIREQYDFRLFLLSLPDLSCIKRIETGDLSFYDIRKVPFLDSYLMTDRKNSHYFLNDFDLVSMASLSLTQGEDENLLINNVRKEFYLPSKYGIKVYDSRFEEKDSLLLFENEPLSMDSIYRDMFRNTPSKDGLTVSETKDFRKYIGEICVFKDDFLLYTINDMLTLTCKVMLYSLKDKTQQEIVELCDNVQYLRPFSDGFCFLSKQNGHIMEVIDG